MMLDAMTILGYLGCLAGGIIASFFSLFPLIVIAVFGMLFMIYLARRTDLT